MLMSVSYYTHTHNHTYITNLFGGKKKEEETHSQNVAQGGQGTGSPDPSGLGRTCVDSETISKPFCQRCSQALLNFEGHSVILIKRSWSTARHLGLNW